MKKLRHAFSMLELVFVIVIMGIIGKFGVEFLANAYQNFIASEIANRQAANSAYAVEFIAKRLEYRVKQSVVVRNSGAGTQYFPLEGRPAGNTENVIEWIGYDIEGFRGNTLTPLWSGIFDQSDYVNNPTRVFSPGTDTSLINSMISELSAGNSGVNDAALYFMGGESDITRYGWSDTGGNNPIQDMNSSLKPIQADANTSLFLANPVGGGFNFTTSNLLNYNDQSYKLVWSAYAVVYLNNQLLLYYDYQPWRGENYLANGKSSVIMDNVSSFYKSQEANIMRIVVCTQNVKFGDTYSVCKEKTIL